MEVEINEGLIRLSPAGPEAFFQFTVNFQCQLRENNSFTVGRNTFCSDGKPRGLTGAKKSPRTEQRQEAGIEYLRTFSGLLCSVHHLWSFSFSFCRCRDKRENALSRLQKCSPSWDGQKARSQCFTVPWQTPKNLQILLLFSCHGGHWHQYQGREMS